MVLIQEADMKAVLDAEPAAEPEKEYVPKPGEEPCMFTVEGERMCLMMLHFNDGSSMKCYLPFTEARKFREVFRERKQLVYTVNVTMTCLSPVFWEMDVMMGDLMAVMIPIEK